MKIKVYISLILIFGRLIADLFSLDIGISPQPGECRNADTMHPADKDTFLISRSTLVDKIKAPLVTFSAKSKRIGRFS